MAVEGCLPWCRRASEDGVEDRIEKFEEKGHAEGTVMQMQML